MYFCWSYKIVILLKAILDLKSGNAFSLDYAIGSIYKNDWARNGTPFFMDYGTTEKWLPSLPTRTTPTMPPIGRQLLKSKEPWSVARTKFNDELPGANFWRQKFSPAQSYKFAPWQKRQGKVPYPGRQLHESNVTQSNTANLTIPHRAPTKPDKPHPAPTKPATPNLTAKLTTKNPVTQRATPSTLQKETSVNYDDYGEYLDVFIDELTVPPLTFTTTTSTVSWYTLPLVTQQKEISVLVDFVGNLYDYKNPSWDSVPTSKGTPTFMEDLLYLGYEHDTKDPKSYTPALISSIVLNVKRDMKGTRSRHLSAFGAELCQLVLRKGPMMRWSLGQGLHEVLIDYSLDGRFGSFGPDVLALLDEYLTKLYDSPEETVLFLARQGEDIFRNHSVLQTDTRDILEDYESWFSAEEGETLLETLEEVYNFTQHEINITTYAVVKVVVDAVTTPFFRIGADARRTHLLEMLDRATAMRINMPLKGMEKFEFKSKQNNNRFYGKKFNSKRVFNNEHQTEINKDHRYKYNKNENNNIGVIDRNRFGVDINETHLQVIPIANDVQFYTSSYEKNRPTITHAKTKRNRKNSATIANGDIIGNNQSNKKNGRNNINKNIFSANNKIDTNKERNEISLISEEIEINNERPRIKANNVSNKNKNSILYDIASFLYNSVNNGANTDKRIKNNYYTNQNKNSFIKNVLKSISIIQSEVAEVLNYTETGYSNERGNTFGKRFQAHTHSYKKTTTRRH